MIDVGQFHHVREQKDDQKSQSCWKSWISKSILGLLLQHLSMPRRSLWQPMLKFVNEPCSHFSNTSVCAALKVLPEVILETGKANVINKKTVRLHLDLPQPYNCYRGNASEIVHMHLTKSIHQCISSSTYPTIHILKRNKRF